MNSVEIEGMIAALEAQRNMFANQVVQMNGTLAMKDARIKELEVEVLQLKTPAEKARESN